MAEASRNDRIRISHDNATVAELQEVIANVTGLADALEVTEDEHFTIKINLNAYGFILSKPIKSETLYHSAYVVKKNRNALCEALITPQPGDHQNIKLRNIIAARMAGGEVQQPWQYRCHPFLLALLEQSRVTPEKFINGMKGHIGSMRTYANTQGYTDNIRRNFTKLLYPLKYEASGGQIELAEVAVDAAIKIRFGKAPKGQSLRIDVPGHIPETIIATMTNTGIGNLFDDPKLNAALAGEKVYRIYNHAGGCVIETKPRKPIAMAEGAHIIDEAYDRIVSQLEAWAAGNAP